jgi:hypothetical protein
MNEAQTHSRGEEADLKAVLQSQSELQFIAPKATVAAGTSLIMEVFGMVGARARGGEIGESLSDRYADRYDKSVNAVCESLGLEPL